MQTNKHSGNVESWMIFLEHYLFYTVNKSCMLDKTQLIKLIDTELCPYANNDYLFNLAIEAIQEKYRPNYYPIHLIIKNDSFGFSYKKLSDCLN